MRLVDKIPQSIFDHFEASLVRFLVASRLTHIKTQILQIMGNQPVGYDKFFIAFALFRII